MPITFELSSLRGKITSAYLVLVAGTVILAVIAFLDLLFLERQVTEGEVVSDLKNAVLEMRREEKNLFLYKDNEVLSSVGEYAVSARDIARRYKISLAEIIGRSETSVLINNLDAYTGRLGQWENSSIDARHSLEEEIRALGHLIYLSVDSLSKQERKILEAAVEESQWFLVIFLFIIGLSIYVVGHLLKRVVLTPLTRLEFRLKSIAEGRFDHLQSPSNDCEFLTLTDAFNRMLNELEIRQRRMLQSEKLASLGILASGVAHELNNPLSNISSSCQLLMEELTEADTSQLITWLKQIDAETERGRNIVRTLLDFGSQRIFKRDKAILHDLVSETKNITESALKRYSAKLTVNIPADLVLEVDKQRIQQLFINLIHNSLHASGEGVNVRISAIVCEKAALMIPDGAEVAGNLRCFNEHNGQVVEIIFSDDGPGIPVEILPNVFEPFFTTSQPGQGVGLGLFIVQEIVSEHDGCVAIESGHGKGTRIILLFPGKDLNND